MFYNLCKRFARDVHTRVDGVASIRPRGDTTFQETDIGLSHRVQSRSRRSCQPFAVVTPDHADVLPLQ